MGSMFEVPVAALHGRFNAGASHGKVDHKGAAGFTWIVAQIAVKRAHEGARKVEPEARRLGALLKWLEQFFRGSNARPGVAHANRNHAVMRFGGDRDALR